MAEPRTLEEEAIFVSQEAQTKLLVRGGVRRGAGGRGRHYKNESTKTAASLFQLGPVSGFLRGWFSGGAQDLPGSLVSQARSQSLTSKLKYDVIIKMTRI